MSQDSMTKYSVPMLIKSMEVLEFLSVHPQGATIQEIVDNFSHSKTTVYRIINSFYDMGYLCRSEGNNRFSLSKKLFGLGLAALGEVNIVERSLEPMRRLRDVTMEAVMLGTLMDLEAVLLEQVLGSHDFTFILKPGSRFTLHSSAPGKVMLAFSKEEEREKIITSIKLTRYNKNTITTESDLRVELGKIRRQGYALDLEEEIMGVSCVAAPVFNMFGHVVAAIWTSGPSGRITTERMDQISDSVVKCADEISLGLGYQSV